MKLEFLKIIVQAALIERDDDGEVVGERLSEPTALYTTDQIVNFIDSLKSELVNANAQENGNRAQRRARAKAKAE